MLKLREGTLVTSDFVIVKSKKFNLLFTSISDVKEILECKELSVDMKFSTSLGVPLKIQKTSSTYLNQHSMKLFAIG